LTAFYEVLHQLGNPVFLWVALSGRNFIAYRLCSQLLAVPLFGASGSLVTMAFTGLDRLFIMTLPQRLHSFSPFYILLFLMDLFKKKQ
jgi:hypothetical protein